MLEAIDLEAFSIGLLVAVTAGCLGLIASLLKGV